MTTPTRLERDLPPPGRPGDGIRPRLPRRRPRSDRAATRQRPAWTFPERWLPMTDITTRQAVSPRVPFRAIGVALGHPRAPCRSGIRLRGHASDAASGTVRPRGQRSDPYVSNGNLYVGDPTTGATRLLVDGPQDIGVPQFSPDGTRVAFLQTAQAAGRDPVDVYVVRADGSGLQRITAASLPDWQWLGWTPDGRQPVVIHPAESDGGGCGTTICHVNQLDLYDAIGSGAVRHLASADGMDFVSFRPTLGDSFLYRARVDGKWGLFAMDADSSNPRTLAEPSVPSGIERSSAPRPTPPTAAGSSTSTATPTGAAAMGDGCRRCRRARVPSSRRRLGRRSGRIARRHADRLLAQWQRPVGARRLRRSGGRHRSGRGHGPDAPWHGTPGVGTG